MVTLLPSCWTKPPQDTWLKRANAVAATTAGLLGRHVVKHIAYGAVSGYDVFKNGIITLASNTGIIPPMIQECVHGAFMAMSAYPVIQSAQHGEAAFWTTTALTYLSWRATQLIPHLSKHIHNAYTEPWVRGALNAASALIPSPHVDESGVSIPKPFSNNMLFLNDFFKIYLGPDKATLHLNDGGDCHMPHAGKIVCQGSNKTVAAHFSEDFGLLLAWGSPQEITFYHVPEISRLDMIKNTATWSQKALLTQRDTLNILDQIATTTILAPFPWTAVCATPTIYPFPIRHQNDRRELPQLLRDDPDLFLAYLNAHASHYMHDHTYSTAPAMIATLFHDLGIQTGGEVLVFKNTNPTLEFDTPQFVFIPAHNRDDPVIVASLANWNSRGLKRGVQTSRLSHFRIQKDIKNTPEYHFMRTHGVETRLTTNLLDAFYKWYSHPNRVLDDIVRGSNLWRNLEERLRPRQDLHDNQLWRIALNTDFENLAPFTMTWHVQDTVFLRGRLHRPRMRSADISPLTPCTRTSSNLYVINIWRSDTFDTEGEHLSNLLKAHHFGSALDNVKQDLHAMKEWFFLAFSQNVVDENFFKVAVATKVLNHKMAGHFFPLVELQSGSGRVDLALFSRDPQQSSVLFEFKYASSDQNIGHKTQEAMHQIRGRSYGAAFDRFPGVRSVKRVGIALSPHQINTDFDTYSVPVLPPQIASPARDLEAFKYQLETFATKHISYHDLNARNPDFLPAVFTSVFIESQNQGTFEIWAGLENNARDNLFFLKTADHEPAVSIRYTTHSDPIAPHHYQGAFQTFHDAHPHITSLKHMSIFIKDEKELTLSDISLHSTESILKNYRPHGPGSQRVLFPQTHATIERALSNLESRESRDILETYLQMASEFNNKLFVHPPQQKEAHLQGLIVGILFAHTDHFDILSLNEEGGVGGNRPDIIFKDANGIMTVIENKVSASSRSLEHVAQAALDQTVRNRYGDIIQKREISGFISASVVFDPNNNVQFVTHHDDRPYAFTDSPSHRIKNTWPTSREHTPEPDAMSSRLATHMATPPMRLTRGPKRQHDEISGLSLTPICKKNPRHRRDVDGCYTLNKEEEEHLVLALTETPRNRNIKSVLHGLNALVGGVLPLTKSLMRGDITGLAQQTALVFVIPTLTHQYTKTATTLANLMDNGLAKTFLEGSSKVVGHAVGGALNILDLGQQIDRLPHANNIHDTRSAELSIAVDTGYAVLDAAEMGLILAGAEGGPLFLSATLALALVDQLGQAGIELERLEEQIQLSSSEKVTEYFRFFAGLGEDDDLKQDLNAQSVYKNVFEQFARTYLQSEQVNILAATLDDIQDITHRRVPHKTTADRRADDYIRGQSWCLFCDNLRAPPKHPHCHYHDQRISIAPTLTATSPSVIEFGDAPHQKLSRIATTPPGTRFLCAPNADDVSASEISRSSHHAARDGTCRVGDTDRITSRIHWPSSRTTGQPFCKNAFVLQKTTHNDGGLVYLLNNDLTHQTPASHPATLYLKPPQDPSKTAHYHITLRHANNIIVPAPSWDRIHFHITGGQYNTLVFQNDYHPENTRTHNHFIQNIHALIGGPASQTITAPEGVTFVDGGGGIDAISVVSDASVVLHNATSIHLLGDSLSLVWPKESSGASSIEPTLNIPHTYNLILSHLNALNNIRFPFENTLLIHLEDTANPNNYFDILNNRFHRGQDRIILTFSPPLENVISQGQISFYHAPLSNHQNRKNDMIIYLTGTTDHFWHTALDNEHLYHLAHLGHPHWTTATKLHDPTQKHVLWIDRHSHVTEIAQPKNRTLSSITRVVSGPSHHYVIQDWIEGIVLHHLSPEHTGTTYTTLCFSEETRIIKGMTDAQNTYLLTQHEPNRIVGFLKINQTPFRLILKQNDTSYGLFPDNSKSTYSLWPTHFLNVHSHRITTVPTDTWHLDDRLRMSTDDFLLLKEGLDGVLWNAQRNASIILKGLTSYITFRGENALWLETPNRSINLTDLLNQAPTLQDHMTRQRRAVLNSRTLVQAIPAPAGTAQAVHNSTISIGNRVVYDIKAHGDDLSVFARNQTGDLSCLTIPDWNTMVEGERPLIIDARSLMDFRNHTTYSLEQNLLNSQPNCSREHSYPIDNAPHVLWVRTPNIPDLHVEKICHGFAVIKNTVHRHTLTRCSETHRFNDQADVWLVFYDHTTPYTDITHNDTGFFHHVSPNFWPLRVNRTTTNLNITPIPFENAKSVLDMSETIH